MKKIQLTKDYGKKETFEKWNGKFLDDSSYDKVYKVTQKEDLGIMKPVKSLDGSDVPLAYVVNNVYPNDDIRDVLTTIEDTSTMRANCSGPVSYTHLRAHET